MLKETFVPLLRPFEVADKLPLFCAIIDLLTDSPKVFAVSSPSALVGAGLNNLLI